ncbi:MAG: ABC transporter permease subunit [Comamonadaceae bacterium]|jgi:putrescine transport system permease protein|nr:MAG: ABC transporter permease subunit [Comamonadaceae bacterium]
MKLSTGQMTSRVWMTLVFVFLYLPIVTLIVLSFNASPMVTSWGGWSLRWYAALAKDAEIIAGFKLSLQIAFLTACASVILGTLAAIALNRFKRFPGRTLFAGMVNSPLVMPEVIIGLSLLLMLVSVQRAFGFPDRGLLTIWFGHTLLGMAYATVVVQSRLQEMSPQFEEAAQDLGCRPWQVFFLVTLPLISQAIGSAWLLTFTLSLDDVVLSAFLSGPGSTTMPITIFSRARLGLSPSVNTVATLTVAVVSVGVVLASVWLSRAERRRAQEMSAAFRGAGG